MFYALKEAKGMDIKEMERITLGIIGTGFAANLHAKCLDQIGGVEIELKCVADLNISLAKDFADKYGFKRYTQDYKKLLDDKDINAVIICTPPVTHYNMIADALNAGKSVLCEKPLTGYFGEDGDQKPVGETVSREKMLDSVKDKLNELEKIHEKSEAIFMYAENYIYAPSIQKAADIITKKKSIITFLTGEICTPHSPSGNAGEWSNMGGGTLLRIGCHPLAAILYLKQVEARARNKEISVKSVMCDSGVIAKNLPEEHRKYVKGRPNDVEDIVTLTITFSDDTKALVISNDNVLGGLVNYVNVYTTDSTLLCNTIPTDTMKTYFVEDDELEDIYISENLTCKLGWNNVFISESVLRGYINQIKEFFNCIINNEEPKSNFKIAKDTVETIYYAYVSSSQGKKIFL